MCTALQIVHCMAPRNANYNVVHMNVLQIVHCTALGDNNYFAVYISGSSWSCIMHNLHAIYGSPGSLSLRFTSSKMNPDLE